MTVQLISVPYNLGHYNLGIGAGPTHFVENGAKRVLVEAGHDVVGSRVDFKGGTDHEVGAAMAVNRILADKIREASTASRFPLFLAGNCNNCLGALAALQDAEIGVVWFDAHGDFHTPDTSVSGFFDGFSLGVAVGRSWGSLADTIPGFTPARERNVVLAGVRELDHGEDDLVRQSSMCVCDGPEIAAHGIGALMARLDALERRTDRVYVHLDLDVLDPEVARWNEFTPDGGLHPKDIVDALDMIGNRFDVSAAAISAYNPNCDPEGIALGVGLEVLVKLAEIGDK